jgi:PKD repeat protein
MSKRVLKVLGTLAVLAWLGWILTGCAGISLGVAAFIGNPTAGVKPLTVQFTDQSTGTPISWAWDFNGDGVIDSTIQNPSYTYTTAGIYTVSLTVSYGSLGTSTETKKDYIKVGDAGAGVPGGQATIGAAIAAAPPGGIVLVGAGTYHEDITIDKAGLSLLAASRPVIDGNVLVSASGVTIKGFDITGYVGVTTAGTDVTVLDCTYKARQLTADAHHDRNSSVFKASDGTLWAFFARGRPYRLPLIQMTSKVSAGGGYDIAYLKSTDGGASWTEGTLPALTDLGTAHGAIWPAAFQDNTGKIWVFYNPWLHCRCLLLHLHHRGRHLDRANGHGD